MKIKLAWKVIFSYVAIFILSLFMLSIADTGWRKGAYKCMQSLFLFLMLYPLVIKKLVRYFFIAIVTINIGSFYYYTSLYGEVDSGTVLSILETNSGELFEFFKTLDLTIVSISVLFAILFSLILLKMYSLLDLWKPKKYKLILPFVLSFLAFTSDKTIKSKSFDVASKRTIKFLEQDVHTHFLAAYMRYQSIMSEFDRNVSMSWEKVTVDKSKQKDVYFIVIGESARKDAYGVYSPQYNTTPSLGELPSFQIVSEPISPGVQTRESVIRILSLNDKKGADLNRNIIGLANEAGLKTFWLSNQSKVGENDTTITAIAKKSDVRIFLNNGHYRKSGKDKELIPHLMNTLKDKASSKLIIFHVMGSHNSFCARIWKKIRIDNILDREQCYYNSIENNFRLFKQAIDIFKSKKLSYKAVLLSDHGLVRSTRSPYFVHGAGKRFNKDAVSVPLVFAYDREIGSQVIRKRYFLRDFVHTFAQWTGISAKKIDLSKSILSEQFIEQENFILRSDFSYKAL